MDFGPDSSFGFGGGAGGGGGALTALNDGLSITGTTGKLGQLVSAPGNPGMLLENREIPLNSNFLKLSGPGSLYLNVDVAQSAQNIVFFGDSITVGFNATDNAHRYSTLTAVGLGLTEINNGLSGSTLELQTPTDPYGTQSMVERIGLIPTYGPTYRWLVFLYGINDIQYNGTNYTAANFQTDFQTVISAALGKGWPAGSIALCSTCYVDPANFTSQFGNPPATNARQVAFNAVISTLAGSNGCMFFDAYAAIFNNGAGRLMNVIHPLNSGHQYVAMGLIGLLKSIRQSGQKLAVSGESDFDNLKFLGFGNAATNALPLAVNGDGTMGVAGTVNAVVLSSFSKALFGGALLTEASETVIADGGYKGQSMRLNGALEGVENIGDSIEMAITSPGKGSISVFNRGTATGGILSLCGYGPSKVTVGDISLVPGLATLAVSGITDILGNIRVQAGTALSGSVGAGIEMAYTNSTEKWGDLQVFDRVAGVARVFSINPIGGNVVINKSGDVANDNGATLQVAGEITTSDPGAGIGKWRLGKVVTALSALDTTRYIQVMIDGVVVKLGVIA